MSLDVVIYRAGQEWAAPKLDAFANGLRKHGIEPTQRRAGDWRPSDLAVVWAHRDAELHDLQRDAGNHYLVLERGYIGDLKNRRRWTSAGYDGLNGRADFCNADVGPARWEKHFAQFMEPTTSRPGDYALLMGQVRGDASLEGLKIESWYAATARVLNELGWTVMFRPHPDDPTVAPDGTYSLVGSLSGGLASAAVVVTWNSNSAVDAVLAGVPAVSMDRGSMAWDVTAHDLDDCFIKPDRPAWAAKLAHTMWNDDELSGGDAWDQLKGYAS